MRRDHKVLVSSDACNDIAARACRRTRRIEAFAPQFRPLLHELCGHAEALEDLAESFPALLFAYVTGYATPADRLRSIGLVRAGAPLRIAAAAVGLPLWLKRLPPGAFTEPLRTVPQGEEFATRIHGLVPEPRATGPWLARLLLANEVCNADTALWVARQYQGASPSPSDRGLLHLLAWIWHADRPGTIPHSLLGRGWQPQQSARRAGEETDLWRQRLALAVALGSGVKDTWVAEGHCRGYDFVALRTAEDFIAEAARMDNCLDQYAYRLEDRAVRIFSIRKNGRSVANLEIACHVQELGMPAVAQLRGARNRRAGPEIWQAAYAWLGSSTIRPADPALMRHDEAARRRTRVKMWRPFLTSLSAGTREPFSVAIGIKLRETARPGSDCRPISASPARTRLAKA